MRNFNKRTMLGIGGMIAIVATVVYAATYERIPQDKLILGSGTTGAKVFEADFNKGANNPKIRLNNTSPEIEFSTDGVNYKPVGAGGGGGSLTWEEPSGYAPIRLTEFGRSVFEFEAGSSSNLIATIKIDPNHIAGTQKFMRILHYSASTSNTVLMQATTYLIRKGTDATSSTTNFHNSTNTAITNSGVANQLNETILDLTDSSGDINAVSVSAGDELKVVLTRGTDTDTASTKFIPNDTEVL